MNDVEIRRSQLVKFLGVQVDEGLTWSKHIETTENKVRKSLFILSQSFPFLPPKHKLMLYNSMVLPHLSYCAIVWGQNYPSRLKKIRSLQNRAIRLVSGVNNRHTSSILFKNLQTLKFDDIVKVQILTFMFRFLNHSLPDIFNNYFHLKAYTHHNTRHLDTFSIPFTRRQYRKFSISFIGPKLWNDTFHSNCFTDIKIGTFKANLKQLLISHY